MASPTTGTSKKPSLYSAKLPNDDSSPAVKRRPVHSNDTSSVSMGEFSIEVDAYSEKGVRKQMEDEHLICFSLKPFAPNLPPERDFSVFAVMDGHGGRLTASFVREQLATEIASQIFAIPADVPLPFPDKTIKQAVSNAFSKVDSRIATEVPSCRDGCTAVVVLMKGSLVYVANLGDSSACLCRKKDDALHAIPLTEVHKPWVIAEKDRILKCGGTIENGRVAGILEVTRSFGDISLKKYGVLCSPTFRKFSVDPQDLFLLVGCDGFWSGWTATEAVHKTEEFYRKEVRRASVDVDRQFELREICKNLVEYVIVEKKSQDNVTVLMIRFTHSTH